MPRSIVAILLATCLAIACSLALANKPSPLASCRVVKVVGSREVDGVRIAEAIARCGTRRAIEVNASLGLGQGLWLLIELGRGEAKIYASTQYPYAICSARARVVGKELVIEIDMARSGAPLRTMLIADRYAVALYLNLRKLEVVNASVYSETRFFSGCPSSASLSIPLRGSR